jgi:hypothetical protein
MDENSTKQACTDSEASQAALRRMIIKLRWLGMEDEAKQLELEARRWPIEQRSGAAVGPFCTD